MKFLFLFILSIFAIDFAFAQAAAVAAPTYLDSVLAWVAANPGMLASVVAVLEVVLRLVPSANAMSILVPVQYAVSGIAKILAALSDSVLAPIIQNANNVTATASLKK